MTREERVLFEKMVEINGQRVTARRRDKSYPVFDDCARRILDLLDCIVDFREPLKELAVEDGCGKLVVGDE